MEMQLVRLPLNGLHLRDAINGVRHSHLTITSTDGHRGAYVSGEARQRLSLLKMLQNRRTCIR